MCVFGPPGSGFVSQRYGRLRILPSSSKVKLIRKTMVPSVLYLLYDFLSSKNDVNVQK